MKPVTDERLEDFSLVNLTPDVVSTFSRHPRRIDVVDAGALADEWLELYRRLKKRIEIGAESFRLATFHQSRADKAEAELAQLRAAIRGAGEALHGGAQALSSMAHDMDRRHIDKTDGLRAYATTLRSLIQMVNK